MTEQKISIEKLSLASARAALKPRKVDSHKGDFGHVLIAGGELGFSGAVMLAGEASLRVGAGLVSIATREQHAAVMNLSRPELMCHAVSNRRELSKLAAKSTVVAIGPGLGQTRWSIELFELIASLSTPKVIDADGLNILAQSSGLPFLNENHVLTPHVGEAARLLACNIAEIQQDRLAAVMELQKRFAGVVVLKGAGSLIYDGSDKVFICELGNPGMASAGMGDVLTGVIASFIAQGHSTIEATKMAVVLHASAGDLAAKGGERGLLASDLFIPLRQLVN